ncbi:RNA polymerase sporulation-specific sigma factor [Selenomonas ruminantium]|uniref:RNA polymerase sporulation-specific sigma factor n=2 Tax=Selenomonas TaxID=970 RepID=A0A1I3CE49_SELRU|nr:RNA polymerase sporulation-specific sigma factor [Selenomonas ruminantium]
MTLTTKREYNFLIKGSKRMKTGVFSKGESAMEAEPTTELFSEELYGEFADLTDEEILLAIRDKDDKVALDYLINKYRNFVRAKARSYFLIGADREDIIQEGMIGFYKAIRDFRNDKLSSFRAFAELCVTRQIITAIKTATRQKHIPLNSYISLNKPIYDEDSDRTLLDVLSGAKAADPEDLVISREEFIDIEKKMEEILSDLEWKVLMSYLDGKSYQEIAEDLDRHVKSIDNALQRVKRKLEKYMENRGDEIDISTVYRGLSSINRRLRGVTDDDGLIH